MLCAGLFLLVSLGTEAQIHMPRGGAGGTSRSNNSSGIAGKSGTGTMPNHNDSTLFGNDTSEIKGLIFNTETPDSVLKEKVFYFHHRKAQVWIDEVMNPSLDPTGVQFGDALDALNGNYFLGKGALGHPHIGLFPTLTDGLQSRLQADAFEGYRMTMDNIRFYQTLTPYSMLSYGGSLAKDHQLQLVHTQNFMPGWNAAFEYRLLNPEGVFTSSGAVNHYLNATTNYFSADSRLQIEAAIIHHSFNIDENGGLANDSIFIQQLQSNRAGIPVVMNGAGTRVRGLQGMASVKYSLERQSDAYRHRDSLVAVPVGDSTTRLDTLEVVDTIPLHKPHVLNAGVVGLELNAHREKRVFADSTLWREQSAMFYWTNDAYADHRWHNPLKITIGILSQHQAAAIGNDTLQLLTWFDPFARATVLLGRATLTINAETRSNMGTQSMPDHRLDAQFMLPLDSAGRTNILLSAKTQTRTPDVLLLHYAHVNQNTDLTPTTSHRLALGFTHQDHIDLQLIANYRERHTWIDTLLLVHQGNTPLWLLQARATMRLHAGPIHLDMQQLVQYSTDQLQLPLPLWMSKNSLYADFHLFHHLLHAQIGTDIRYHTPYHAPLYDPRTGLFLQQDKYTVGGYLWADAFINIQVKRASIYVKAGHVNALWEIPATYFLLPHYPGQKFGVQWGLTWQFFD